MSGRQRGGRVDLLESLVGVSWATVERIAEAVVQRLPPPPPRIGAAPVRAPLPRGVILGREWCGACSSVDGCVCRPRAAPRVVRVECEVDGVAVTGTVEGVGGSSRK